MAIKHFKLLNQYYLEQLPTHRLLGVLRAARAVHHARHDKLLAVGWCCEICKEWIRSKEDYQTMVAEPLQELINYIATVKKILEGREHIS